MLESGQNWELFGYDTRNIGRHFSAAFRELVLSYDSPLRAQLDEVVRLRDGEGERYFHAGLPCDPAPASCEAVLLPEELVLVRHLRMPLAVESELDSAVSLEAASSSPFAANDTGVGWQVTSRDEQFIHVQVAIVSLSAVMAFVGQHFGSHDAQAQEVWVEGAQRPVVVRGFGESRREKLYRRRLLRVAALVGGAAAIVLAMLLVGAGFKKWELERLSDLESATRQQAAAAMQQREILGDSNVTITAVGEIAAQYPNPHQDLALLTALLDDTVYVERLAIEGREIDIRGKAENAAQVMELLTKQAAFAGVTAGSPIRKLPNTNREQFHLKVQRAEASQ